MKNKFKTRLLVSSLVLTASISAALPLTAADKPIVIEDLSRSELRAQIERVENEFYRVFNSTSDNELLEITCSSYVPTDSHISQRACEPRFLTKARNENVNNWRNDVDVLLSTEELQSALTQEFEQLTEAMNTALKENEYFRELNGVLRMLRERMTELDS